MKTGPPTSHPLQPGSRSRPVSHGWIAIGVLMLLLQPAMAADDRGRGDELTRFMTRLGYSAVELEVKNRSMLVLQGKVNARKATLLIDTGFTFTTLDATRARGLPRLEPGRLTLEDPALGTVASSNFVLVESLEIGALKFSNQPAQVMDLAIDMGSSDTRSLASHASLGGGRKTIRFQAVLGGDFLRRHGAVLRPGTGMIYLRAALPPPDASRALGETLAVSGMAAVSLTDEYGVHLFAPVQLDGHTASLFLDTGSLATVTDAKFAAQARMASRTTGGALRGVKGREAELKEWDVRRLQLGPWETRGYRVTVADLRPWDFNRDKAQHEVHGLLGLELIARMDAVIDYGALRLFVRATVR